MAVRTSEKVILFGMIMVALGWGGLVAFQSGSVSYVGHAGVFVIGIGAWMRIKGQ